MARADDAPRKVNGPKVPGAKDRPKVGRPSRKITDPAPSRKNRKSLPPPKDEVERSDRYVKKMEGTGGLSAHAIRIRKIERLKELIEPLTPSLIQVMSDIAHDKKVHPAVRLDAADRLLNRLYGKPTEKVEVSDPYDDQPEDEVKTLLNRILESVGAPLLEFHDENEISEPSPRRNAQEPDEKEARP